MIQPSPPPSLYPCQLRCHGCGTICNMPPSTVSDKFFCPNCHLHQTTLPVPLCSNSSRVLRVKVQGIDPYKMQVVCAYCMAILNIPPEGLGYSSTRFKCPLCRLKLPCFIFPVDSASTASWPAEALECMDDDSGMKNVTPTDNVVEEEPVRSIFLLKDKKRVREFDKVDDCFILDFDPCGFSSDSKCLDDQVEFRSRPHQNKLCANNKTANDIHSKECYCYIHDIIEPCNERPKGDILRHCDAIANDPYIRTF